ncbi:CGNR zinc finger domain-containing protein [Nocardiopsis sp. EMB25]|uniref:CGNR zinc finger domain-containing protein n=1 Tax=Nocardiopsis sp. EMB25 TaxID=2835867 RepID=UPI002283498B|nr:CGNR zinc finger domain-containing protein [Nocardiopsis sp. EMB25]MCY9786017.1 CGNR zinc finger domain-containing protein [Nocardiopsis sp. EMB25]
MNASATGIPMHPPNGASYLFDPGALCLELLTTGGPDELARWEVLHAPDDLRAWLAACRLRLSPSDVGVAEGDVGDARRLRDAILRVTRAAAHDRALPAEDVAEINRFAAKAPLAPEMAPGGTASWASPADASQALSTVARDAVELFTGRFADRVRECGGHNCLLLFVDTSRPGRRRWCAMERCGNREKVRALRARRENQ